MIKDERIGIKNDYLLYLEEVPKHKFACKAVKISEDTSKRWRDEDIDFADECEAKIAAWVKKMIKRTRPEYQLERLLREDFAPSSAIHVNNEDKPLPSPIYAEMSSSNIKK